MSAPKPVTTTNPNLANLKVDHFYHIGFDTSMPLKEMFGDVKFVLFGGANDRMKSIAEECAKAFWPLPLGSSLSPIGSTARYHMYKIGSIITVSHQMGMPSFSILLHEVTKLLAAAQATDVVYFRLGTSGGVGLEPGTVVITDTPFNGYLEPYYDLVTLGKLVKRPSSVDSDIKHRLLAIAQDAGYVSTLGNTMSVDCFYEGQARLDGAIAEHTEADKFAFLQVAHDKGVRNIEMESVMFGAFCQSLGIKCGVVCTTLVNRLKGDQVSYSHEESVLWIGRCLEVVIRYIAETLNLPRHDIQ